MPRNGCSSFILPRSSFETRGSPESYHADVRLPAILLLLACSPVAAGDCTGPLFEAPVRYAVAADEVVLLADLDGDAAPEILTSGNAVDQLGAFSLLPNRGDGTFAAERLVATGFGEKLEDVADLDRDGTPDLLASAYWQNGIATYRGLGALQFVPGQRSDTATHGGPSRVLDYDRDGLTDIVSLSFGSANPVRVHLFRGRAGGTFEPKVTVETALPNAISPSARIVDGRLEILGETHFGHLALLRFGPDGIAVSTREAGPGFDLSSVFADVNGDGVADIVDANDGGDDGEADPLERIFVTLAGPAGTLLERKQLARPRKLTFPAMLEAADFDRDGRIDLIAGDYGSATLYSFRGDGKGSFGEGVALDAGGPVTALAAGDVNRDGRPDLVAVSSQGHSVSVIVNRSACTPERRRAVRH